MSNPGDFRRASSTWNWQVQPKGWLRALGPLFGPIGNRVERGIWTGLKRHLEDAAPKSPG